MPRPRPPNARKGYDAGGDTRCVCGHQPKRVTGSYDILQLTPQPKHVNKMCFFFLLLKLFFFFAADFIFPPSLCRRPRLYPFGCRVFFSLSLWVSRPCWSLQHRHRHVINNYAIKHNKQKNTIRPQYTKSEFSQKLNKKISILYSSWKCCVGWKDWTGLGWGGVDSPRIMSTCMHTTKCTATAIAGSPNEQRCLILAAFSP